MTVKDFILKFANDLKKAVERMEDEGYAKAIKDFINEPLLTWIHVRDIHKYKGDVALFEVPCRYCGKPIVFTHKDENWEPKVKPELRRAFRYWRHTDCKRSLS